MEHVGRSLGIALALLLVQRLFLPFVTLAGFSPDLFIPWLVYTALRRGQLEATVVGFGAGLLQDAAVTQFFGLAAFSKTITAFLAGYFFNENSADQTLGSYRFVLIVAVCSLVHNVAYYTIALQGVEGDLVSSVLRLSAGTMFYTAVVSLLPMFSFSRRYNTRWAQ